ncbi:MAG: G8 domain-containing protein [Pseudonocardiales bacterium]
MARPPARFALVAAALLSVTAVTAALVGAQDGASAANAPAAAPPASAPGSTAATDHVGEFAASVHWDTVAARSGTWSDPGTWNTGAAPRDGADVKIPTGMSVTIRGSESTPMARVLAEGALVFDPTKDTRLVVDTLLVATSGRLTLGTAAAPLAAGRTAQIVIASHPKAPLDVAMKTRGILAQGTVETNAPHKSSKARLVGDAPAGSTSLAFADDLGGWRVGDQIDVTGTYYRPLRTQKGGAVDLPPLENELRTVTAISGRTVTLDFALKATHRRAAKSVSIYVANLTRAVSVSSAKTTPITERGHVMFMQGARVTIANTGFYGLGRTRKDVDLSDTNVPGVYPVHFHRDGYDNLQKVTGSVVQGTPGWGIVNHSSALDASDNVVHDFVGSAYVSEAGDEIGSFTGNLASGGSDHPVGPKVASRVAVSPEQRIRAAKGDMGKFATGFWLVSPSVRVEDNVVAGSRGTAYFLFGLGTAEDGKWTGPPLDQFPAGTNPRTWAYPNQYTGAKMGLTADMPVKSFRGNVAYGVFQGLRVRWSNDSDAFLLTRTGTRILENAPSQIQGSADQVHRTVSVLSNLTFWNVASGISTGYSGGFDIDHANVINGPEYHPDCTNGAVCTEGGIYLADGGGGSTTQVRNSSVANVTDPITLATKGQQTVVNTTTDGRPYTGS